jgi:hypothetical protein
MSLWAAALSVNATAEIVPPSATYRLFTQNDGSVRVYIDVHVHDPDQQYIGQEHPGINEGDIRWVPKYYVLIEQERSWPSRLYWATENPPPERIRDPHNPVAFFDDAGNPQSEPGWRVYDQDGDMPAGMEDDHQRVTLNPDYRLSGMFPVGDSTTVYFGAIARKYRWNAGGWWQYDGTYYIFRKDVLVASTVLPLSVGSIDSRTMYGLPNATGAPGTDPNAPRRSVNFTTLPSTFNGGLFIGNANEYWSTKDQSRIARIQMQFQVPTLPAGAAMEAATLSLYYMGFPGPRREGAATFGTPFQMRLYASSDATHMPAAGTWETRWTPSSPSGSYDWTNADWTPSSEGSCNMRLSVSSLAGTRRYVLMLDPEEPEAGTMNVPRWRYFCSPAFAALPGNEAYLPRTPRLQTLVRTSSTSWTWTVNP